jgi:MoaA/NifB/PqqE/SkfB family radical SAM enzyme
MKLPHDKFCVLPWVSLETSPVGTVRPCCLAEEEIEDDSGRKFDLKTATFQDIQHSEHMRELRTEFLAGQRPETCRKCWNEEDAGRTSKRMHTLDRLKHVLPDQSWTQDAKPLMFLDLKLGNICNLKCRICGSWSSSTFATEEVRFVQPGEDPKHTYHYLMLRNGSWPRDNQQFWAEVSNISDQIRYLEFTGGEPFMIQEHFDFLQRLVDQGLAPNIEIHYNTNGTIWPQHGPDIWQHFRTVEVAFSIDDLGERFEYQRANARWTEVEGNIHRFRELRNIMPNLRLQCCSTVNVFNVRYIDQLAWWIASQDFDFVYWNMLHEARYLSIANLPVTAKQEIADHLWKTQIPRQYRQEFDRIIDFMEQGEPSDGVKLRSEIRKLDQRRDQDITQVLPELAELIGYERS